MGLRISLFQNVGFVFDISVQTQLSYIVLCALSPNRFHKLVWGKHGMTKGTNPNGLIVGGTDNGTVYVYDAEKLLGGSEALVQKMDTVS